MKRWEITFLDSGVTVVWSTRKCHKFFGKAEFGELKQGYAPHIVCVETQEELTD